MSYNGYNQYSPYYQGGSSNSQQQHGQPSAGSQYQNESRTNGAYSSGTYQPLSAYQSEHQRKQQHNNSWPSTQSGNTHNSPGYGSNDSYGGQSYGNAVAGTTAEQSFSNSYSTTRSDGNNLGNLAAYASAIGQDSQQPTLSQLIEYNRSREKANYGATSPFEGPQSHHRMASNGQSHATAYPGLFQGGQNCSVDTAGRSSPAQYQYSNPSQQQTRTYGPNQHSQPPSRPSSGQAMPRTNYTTGHQDNHSPQILSGQMPQAGRSNTGNYSYKETYQPSPANTPGTNSSLSKPPTQVFSTSSTSSAQRNKKSGKSQAAKSTQQPASQTQTNQPSSVKSVYGQQEQQAPSTENEGPRTVDPSQVFDLDSYQRRQSEEAARKEKEAQRNKKAKSTATSPQGDDVTQTAQALMKQSGSANSDSTTKEQIELEMKAMIEKMRDYKAKDPNLFSQVWDEVKKVGKFSSYHFNLSDHQTGNPNATCTFAACAKQYFCIADSEWQRRRHPAHNRCWSGITS